MNTITFTSEETKDFADGCQAVARFFRVEIIDMLDAYAALVEKTIQLLENVEFAGVPERGATSAALRRQAETIPAQRHAMAHYADQLNAMAALLDQRRRAATEE